MNVIGRILERLALIVLLIGGAGMLMAVFLGTGDVVGTPGFGRPIAGTRELTESTMVLIVFGALAYAQIRRSHIRVELLYTRLSARGKTAMDIVADIAALVFFGLMCWQAVGEAQYSYQIGEVTDGLIEFPLVPARFILVAGTAIMIVRLVFDFITDIGHFVRRDDVYSGSEPIIPDLPIPDIEENQ